MVSRRTFRATLALALGAATLAVSPAGAASRGGTMTFGRYADSLFLDPVLNANNVDIWILSNLYDTLLLPTDDGKGVQPGLASAYLVAPDGNSVALTLREGIRFSDGSHITAEDVKWSLDRARDPKAGIWNFIDGSIGSVEIKDPKTVVLNLKHPDPTILAALSVFNNAVMPSKLFMAVAGTTLDEKAKAFAEHPVGSGPFAFQSWSPRTDDEARQEPLLLAPGIRRKAAALSRRRHLRDPARRRHPDTEGTVG